MEFRVRGPLGPDDLPGLTDRVCALFAAAAPRLARCDVTGVPADAVTVDALARLQLLAGRYGCRVVLRGCSPPLRELVDLLGLTDVLAEETADVRAAAATRTAGRAGRWRGRR